MDEKNEPFHIQPGDGKSYTLNEYLSLTEPQYRENKAAIQKCITGLTGYAAQLAAQHQEEQLPQLRRLCVEMAEFWGLTDDDTPKGYQKMAEQYGGAFDRAASAARESGQAPEMSDQTKKEVLDGLELYAQEMTANGDLEPWVIECDLLAEQLQVEWQAEAAPQQDSAPQIDMKMQGM